ncbi:MAG: hypothetical protein B0D92_00830 [Spirochaeta sp. LUC14_002_19_P3]|nr:MAG: hypothetical protein B0D92_00830 [Spirochaeta sp. LUC14_002_19_P3]
MLKRLITVIILIFPAFAHADVNFSIRYYDKTIYYPEDPVELKLTLVNQSPPGSEDAAFFLADDLRLSFGFDLRSLTGEAVSPAEGYAAALNSPGGYRYVNLAPGQELSMVVKLNDWVQIKEPEQYRLTGFFYPQLRGPQLKTSQADNVLNLTVLPNRENHWMDKLEENIRSALVSRELDPVSVVKETFESRAASKFNRAIIYLDMESLAKTLPAPPDTLEKSLLSGIWKNLPGLDQPSVSLDILSSQVYDEEAIVQLIGYYQNYGEQYDRNLRIYLHRPNGYWAIRRLESLSNDDMDSSLRRYATPAMNPPEVVSALIKAAIKGDWDIVFRYYSISDTVKTLPEYMDSWKNMSSVEHNRALADYRTKVINGTLNTNQLPLGELEEWEISSVSYTELSGSVIVRNFKTYSTAAGPLRQQTRYTFRLERPSGVNGKWLVTRYDTARVNE